MPASHHHGRLGEEMAALFLMMSGLRLLQRRFRVPGGEIDLVMAQGATIVFVEVKTRAGGRGPAPEWRLTGRQWAVLRRTGLRWLIDHGMAGRACRFDAVVVDMGREGDTLRLRHYPAAWPGALFAKGDGPL